MHTRSTHGNAVIMCTSVIYLISHIFIDTHYTHRHTSIHTNEYSYTDEYVSTRGDYDNILQLLSYRFIEIDLCKHNVDWCVRPSSITEWWAWAYGEKLYSLFFCLGVSGNDSNDGVVVIVSLIEISGSGDGSSSDDEVVMVIMVAVVMEVMLV